MVVLDPVSQYVPPTDFVFPKRTFGSTKPKQRACYHGWFEKHKWLHYEVSKDVALCFVCYTANKQGKLSSYTCFVVCENYGSKQRLYDNF